MGASSKDWNENSFWFEPWGRSGVHKGIDIFGKLGTDITSTTDGIVVFTGEIQNGGKVIVILGPKWHFHYFAATTIQAIFVHVAPVLPIQWQ